MNAFSSQPQGMYKLMTINDVSISTGLSRSTIYEKVNPKSRYYDPTFPKQIFLSTNRVAWLVDEINSWIESRMAQRN